MIKRLRIKFICINMAIVLLMHCAIFATVFHFTQRGFEQRSLAFMQTIAANPLRVITPGDRSPNVQLPFFVMDIDAAGKVILLHGGYFNLDNLEGLYELAVSTISTDHPTGIFKDYSLRYYYSETPMAKRIVFVDISNEVSTIRHLIKNCMGIGTVSLLLFLLISILLSHWAVKPVAAAWAQQRRFIADASHELKTPLSLILTNAEMLESGSLGGNSPARIANIREGACRMQSLVERLLDLARVDSGIPKAQRAALNWSRLVSRNVLSFEAVFLEMGYRYDLQLEEGLIVEGSGEHLTQVVDILLDNACKYAMNGSEISIVLKSCGRRCCVFSVENEGNPIPANQHENIFRRFYRMDEARATQGSYGLGLSIAQAIIKEHCGKIWVETTATTNKFCVSLPCHQAKPTA